MTDEQIKRVREIADNWSNFYIEGGKYANEKQVENAILAALRDPLLTKHIVNEALERAARVCNDYAVTAKGIASDYPYMREYYLAKEPAHKMDADAIRALKEKK